MALSACGIIVATDQHVCVIGYTPTMHVPIKNMSSEPCPEVEKPAALE